MQSQKLADSVLDMLVSKNSDGGNSYDGLLSAFPLPREKDIQLNSRAVDRSERKGASASRIFFFLQLRMLFALRCQTLQSRRHPGSWNREEQAVSRDLASS